jgi:hypothetical protein
MIVNHNCIFNIDGRTCQDTKKGHLTYLICKSHLQDLFGLELEFQQFETPTQNILVGGFLRPVQGKFFEKNTVIFPTQSFFDKTYNGAETTVDDDPKYKMNPSIEAYYRKIAARNSIHVTERYVIEMIRNLSVTPEKIDVALQKDSEKEVSKAFLRSKRIFAESMLKDTNWYKKYVSTIDLMEFKDTYVKIENKSTISVSMMYALSYCLLSFQLQSTIWNPLMYNCRYDPSVGLVTTENVYFPSELVIMGEDHSNNDYVKEVVKEVSKQFTNTILSTKDIPEKFAKQNLLKGSGNAECLFG